MIAISQSGRCAINNDAVLKIYCAGEDGSTAIRIDFGGGVGEKMGTYQNMDHAKTALEMYVEAASSGDRIFRFPSVNEIMERIRRPRQSRSSQTSMKKSHGGS